MRCLLLAGLLLLPALAPAADACAVPCGYVYPLIRIELDKPAAPHPLPKEGGLDLEALVTFTFDAYNEGAGPEEPGKPIVISFEYPKKPKWVEITTDPETITVPIQPQYVQPDASDPNNVKLVYVYTTPVKIHVELVDQAVLRSGAEFAKLLVFAKSTESGLYKPAYGIKEIRVAPEDPVFEDLDVASASAPPAPRVTLAPAERALGAATLRFVPDAEQAELWVPSPMTVALDPPQPATLSASLVDEVGRVLYTTGPRLTRDGALTFNLTFPEVGAYLVLASAAPTATTQDAWPATTVGFPVATPPAGAVRLPQAYKAVFTEAASEVQGNTADPTAQFEKFIPLPVYADASSGTLAVALKTSGAAAASGGAGNLNLQLLDPMGAVVAQGVVDMLNPVKSIPVSGFPGAGLYQIRLFGTGANPFGAQGTTVDIVATVNYDGKPVIDAGRDGRFDAPTTVARYGRLNATLAAPFTADPWTSAPFDAGLAFADGPFADFSYTVAVLDAAGTPFLATRAVGDGGLATPLTLPDAGRFLVVFTVTSPDRDFQDTPLAFIVQAGEPDAETVTLPATYVLETEASYAATPAPRPVAAFLVPVREGATSAVVEAPGATLQVRGEDGAVVKMASDSIDLSDLGAGLHRVEVVAGGPLGGSVEVGASAAYPAPVVVANPDAPAPRAPAANGVPGAGVALLALAGAVAAALRRRPA